MRLFVLGATGRTGVELLDMGLARGHEMTAFVRSPAKVSRRDPGLRVVQGDPRDARQMAIALSGHDAALSALGPQPVEAVLGSSLLRDCATETLAAMNTANVRRFLLVSSALLFPGGGAGVGFLRFLIGRHVNDVRAMETIVRESPLEWTIARPPRLVETREEAYRARVGALPEGPMIRAVLSWRAVAAFLLDALEEGRHVREVVGICR